MGDLGERRPLRRAGGRLLDGLALALALAGCLIGGACHSVRRGSAAAADPLLTGETMAVFLLIGQSNMAGRAPIEDVDRIPLPDVFLLNDSSEWEPVAPPLNRYSTVRKAIDMQRLNVGYTFAARLKNVHPKMRIGLVVNARGGTRIREWAKGTELYEAAVSRLRPVLGADAAMGGILWHQGEGDSRNSEYLVSLGQLIADFRSDLAAPGLPFVAGQVEGTRPVNALIAQLPAAVPVTGAALSTGLTTFDGTHFDAVSLREFGVRYANEMLRLGIGAGRAGRGIVDASNE